MSRRAPARALLALLALRALLVPARAQANVTLQGTATVTAGWTDNVLNSVDHPDPLLQRGRESDFFFQVMPGAALTSGSPRLLQRVAYKFTANLFIVHSEGDSYTNELGWSGLIATSPTTTLLLTLQSQQGRLNTFNLNVPSADSAVAVLSNATSTTFFTQTAGEYFTWNPTAQWRASQSAFFRAFIPTDRGTLADSYNFIGEVGGNRLFRLDSVGLLLRANYVSYVAPRNPMTDVLLTANQSQIITALVARWRRDWSPSWSTEAALGVVEAMDAETGGSRVWQPSALAAARFYRDVAAGELHYAHEVVPNPLAGNTFAIDEVVLTASAPLPPKRQPIILGASLGYQHAQLVSAVAGLTGAVADVVHIDFTLGWQPRPEVGVFARYSLFDQFGSSIELPSITRSTVLIGVNVIYPAVLATRVPSRQGARVDSSDQPGFPELHAPPPTP